MDKKAQQRAPTYRRTHTGQRKDAGFHLSLLGFDAGLTVELRHVYADSLSAPLPAKVRDLLARLSTPELETAGVGLPGLETAGVDFESALAAEEI